MSSPAVSAPSERLQKQINRALRISVVDGMFHAAMLGAAESYFSALAVELGHTDFAIAILSTLPLVLGALAQLFAGAPVRMWQSRKKTVVIGAFTQAVALLCLCTVAAVPLVHPAILIAVVSCYAVAGTAIAPPWNAWMASLTSTVDRQRYFSLRSGLIQATLFVSYVSAAIFLKAENLSSFSLLEKYAILALVAYFFRLISAFFLRMQPDPLWNPQQERTLHRPVWHQITDALANSKWVTVRFMTMLYLASSLATPFFAPFALRSLHLDLSDYTQLMAVYIAAQAISYFMWSGLQNSAYYQKHKKSLSLRRVLFFCGFGVALVPLAWALHPTQAMLLGMQLWSGFVWAGIEFASFQLLLGDSSDDDRVSFFALTNSLTGSVQLLGSLMGSALLLVMPTTGMTGNYAAIFLLSGFFRLIVVAFCAFPFVVAYTQRQQRLRMNLRVENSNRTKRS